MESTIKGNPMYEKAALFAGIWMIIGTAWFVIHFTRVHRHDREWNRPPLGPRGWEWPLFFAATVMLWPVAIGYFVTGRRANRTQQKQGS